MNPLLAWCAGVALGGASEPLPFLLPVEQVGPGARILVAVADGEATRITPCLEVNEITSSDGRNVVSTSPTLTEVLGDHPPPIASVAVCPSGHSELSRSLPPDFVALPIPTSVPMDWVEQLHRGDHVDVLAALPGVPGVSEDQTVTLWKDVTVVSPGFLAVPTRFAEKGLHVARVGSLALSVRHSEGRPDVDHMATTVPASARFLAVPLAHGPDPFAMPGDFVDLVISVAGQQRVVLQAVFVVPLGPSGRTLVAYLTPDLVESWVQAARFVTTLVVLRTEDDLAFPEVPTDLHLDARPPGDHPSQRIAPGMRGLSIETGGVSVEVGQKVDLVVPGVDLPGVSRAEVLAVAATADGTRRALLHVSQVDVLRVATMSEHGTPTLKVSAPR